MNIMLGNLTIEEMQERAGVEFPACLIEYMEGRHQPEAASIRPGRWHCFDLPFTLVCGDMETAREVFRHLSPLSRDFKERMNIAVAPAGVPDATVS